MCYNYHFTITENNFYNFYYSRIFVNIWNELHSVILICEFNWPCVSPKNTKLISLVFFFRKNREVASSQLASVVEQASLLATQALWMSNVTQPWCTWQKVFRVAISMETETKKYPSKEYFQHVFLSPSLKL